MKLFFSPSIFDLWLVESTDAKPVDMEGQMYKTQKLGQTKTETLTIQGHELNNPLDFVQL